MLYVSAEIVQQMLTLIRTLHFVLIKNSTRNWQTLLKIHEKLEDLSSWECTPKILISRIKAERKQ